MGSEKGETENRKEGLMRKDSRDDKRRGENRDDKKRKLKR